MTTLRVKAAEEAPAPMVTVAEAGAAWAGRLELRLTTVLTFCTGEMETVPATVPASSEAKAGRLTLSVGSTRVKAAEVAVAEPLVAVSVALPLPSTETLPVQAPLVKAPVVAGVTETPVVVSVAVPVKAVAGWLSTVRALTVTGKAEPEVRGEAMAFQVKKLRSLSLTVMFAVVLGPPEMLAVMTAICAPSWSVSLMILSVKFAEVEPAGMVTVATAGLASVVSFEERSMVVAVACAALMVTVPETLPADSAAAAGSVRPRV